MDKHWGYGARNGPETWIEKFPQAAGKYQSPIDIRLPITSRNEINEEKLLKPLSFHYSLNTPCSIQNTGHGWTVTCNPANTELYGGPLENKFKLQQFHCHWGPDVSAGSEHTINGKQYSAELHFVHFNADKYISFQEAVKHKDGVAVLGVFLENGRTHPEILKITALLPRVAFNGDVVLIGNLVQIDIEKMLPSAHNYWTYSGSLTTPPFSETVRWILFKEPMSISKQQLNIFRSLKVITRKETNERREANAEDHLLMNYRPTLPLNNRTILEFDE